jgi:hypothetical protein
VYTDFSIHPLRNYHPMPVTDAEIMAAFRLGIAKARELIPGNPFIPPYEAAVASGLLPHTYTHVIFISGYLGIVKERWPKGVPTFNGMIAEPCLSE